MVLFQARSTVRRTPAPVTPANSTAEADDPQPPARSSRKSGSKRAASQPTESPQPSHTAKRARETAPAAEGRASRTGNEEDDESASDNPSGDESESETEADSRASEKDDDTDKEDEPEQGEGLHDEMERLQGRLSEQDDGMRALGEGQLAVARAIDRMTTAICALTAMIKKSLGKKSADGGTGNAVIKRGATLSTDESRRARSMLAEAMGKQGPYSLDTQQAKRGLARNIAGEGASMADINRITEALTEAGTIRRFRSNPFFSTVRKAAVGFLEDEGAFNTAGKIRSSVKRDWLADQGAFRYEPGTQIGRTSYLKGVILAFNLWTPGSQATLESTIESFSEGAHHLCAMQLAIFEAWTGHTSLMPGSNEPKNLANLIEDKLADLVGAGAGQSASNEA